MSTAQHTSTVAWLGLGRMGEVMVGRLLDAGLDVAVWNRTAAKCEPLVARGARRLETIADAARESVVMSMVADDAALAALHEPTSGLFSGAASEAGIWIEGSTVSPGAAAQAAQRAREHGVSYVSAPVSGNPGVVAAGNAVFAISGDPAALEVAESLLRHLGRGVHRVGTGTEANVVKLGTNALLAITMEALAEIAVMADKAGVSRGALMDFINDSAVGSPFSRYKSAAIVGLDFTPTFTPELQRKDVRLALQLAAEVETPMPVLAATEVCFSRLVAGRLGEGQDFATLILEAARGAGHLLQPEGS